MTTATLGVALIVAVLTAAVVTVAQERRHAEAVAWADQRARAAEDSLLAAHDRVQLLEQTVAAQAEENRRERAAHRETWLLLRSRSALANTLTQAVDEARAFAEEVRRG